jgi:hypothetical protein
VSGIVLSLCDRSCVAVMPWAEAGYQCIAVDLRPQPNIETVACNVLDYLPPRGNYAMVFAWPPCTHLAVSGARWFREKGLDALAEALPLVVRCRKIAEWSGAPWLLENPVGTLSTYWREPDYKFHPHEYAGYLSEPGGEAYTKKTCLWTGGGFVMPEMRSVPAVKGSQMHLLPPSPDRADLRSVTPAGFARAVFEANHRAAVNAA